MSGFKEKFKKIVSLFLAIIILLTSNTTIAMGSNDVKASRIITISLVYENVHDNDTGYMPNVNISAKDMNGKVIAKGVTDSYGSIDFRLEDGEYVVEAENPDESIYFWDSNFPPKQNLTVKPGVATVELGFLRFLGETTEQGTATVVVKKWIKIFMKK